MSRAGCQLGAMKQAASTHPCVSGRHSFMAFPNFALAPVRIGCIPARSILPKTGYLTINSSLN
jgi:hypothetical protein